MPDPPNLILFFADNLGFADVGCFGAAASRTPNIDRLAGEGLRLKNWNSGASLCSPSRSQTLSGRYAFHLGQQTQLNLNPRAIPNPDQDSSTSSHGHSSRDTPFL